MSLVLGVASVPVARGAAKPDLSVLSLADPPGKRPAGGGFFLDETVRNEGATADASVVRAYLSFDAVRDSDDLRLTGQRKVAKLRKSATSSASTALLIPMNTPAATYHLIACADDKKQVQESNESNNCTTSATTIDVTALDVDFNASAEASDLTGSLSNISIGRSLEGTVQELKTHRPFLCPKGGPAPAQVAGEDAVGATRAFLVSVVGEQVMTDFENHPMTATAEAARETAVAAMNAELPGAALAAMITAIVRDPASANNYINAAALATDVGRADLALGLLDAGRMQAERGASPMGIDFRAVSLANQGKALIDQRRWSEAQAVLTEALRIDPRLSEASGLLGQVLLCLGKTAKAAGFVLGALTRTPVDDPGFPGQAEPVVPVVVEEGGPGPKDDLTRLPLEKVLDLSQGTAEPTLPAVDVPASAADMAKSFQVFSDAGGAFFSRSDARLGELSPILDRYYAPDVDREPIEDWRYDHLYDAALEWWKEPTLAPLAEERAERLERLRAVDFEFPDKQGSTPAEQCRLMQEAAQSSHTRWRAEWLGLHQATNDLYERAYPFWTGIVSNVSDPDGRRLLELQIEGLADHMLTEPILEAQGWATGLTIFYDPAIGCSPDGSAGAPPDDPTFDPTEGCPSALKGVKVSFDSSFDLTSDPAVPLPERTKLKVKAELSCESLKVEYAVPVFNLLGAFASISTSFKSGTTTIFMGGSASGGPLGGVKSGLYFRFGEGVGVKGGVIDVGWRVEVSGGASAGPIKYEFAKDSMDFSFVKGIQYAFQDVPDTD